MKYRFRKIILFTLPISATNLTNILSNFLAIVFLAQLGLKEVAAVTLSSSLFFSLLTIAITCSYAVSILISHALGKSNGRSKQKAGRVFNAAIIANLLLSIPISFLLWHGETLLIWTGQNPELSALTKPFFHFAALALLPNLLSMINSQFFIGIGMPRISLALSIIRLFITTFFSYSLILGKFSLPSLGTGGITAAIGIGQTVNCLAAYGYLLSSPQFKPYRLFHRLFHTRRAELLKFFQVGLPIGMQFGGELFAIAILTMMIGHLGIDALAASQIVSQLGLFLIMIMLGVAQSLSVLTSTSYSQKNVPQIKQDLYASIVLLSIIYCVIGLGIALLHRQVFQLFFDVSDKSNQYLLYLTIALMLIRWCTLWVDGLRNLFSATLRGLQLSAYPMRIGLQCLWLISLPIAYVIGFIFKGGAIGLSIGFSTGFIIANFILWQKLKALYKKLNQMR